MIQFVGGPEDGRECTLERYPLEMIFARLTVVLHSIGPEDLPDRPVPAREAVYRIGLGPDGDLAYLFRGERFR